MWEKLDLVRIYTKPKGKQPDYNSPVVLKRSRCSVEDFCNNIHKDIAKQLKCAFLLLLSCAFKRREFRAEVDDLEMFGLVLQMLWYSDRV